MSSEACGADLIARAKAARGLTAYIEHAFNRMPWRRERLLSSRETYWEILSYLYIEQDAVITKSDCVRQFSGMSQNTADYQLNALIQAGVLVQAANPHDRRSKAVSLSPDAKAALDAFFQSIEVQVATPESRGT